MPVNSRLTVFVRSATQSGLQYVGRLLWIGYGLLLVAAVFLTVSPDATDQWYGVSLPRVAVKDVPALSDDLRLEQAMVERVVAGESLQFELSPSGVPILYAWSVAPIYESFGNRGLALFNVVCLLVTMLVIRRMGLLIWSVRGRLAGIESLSDVSLNEMVAGAQTDESVPQPVDDPQASINGILFGVVAMLIFACNPIVFSEATRPSPRPFAYLLSTLALQLSLRVLKGERLPKLRCLLLIGAAALVHLPAIVIAVPVLLIARLADRVASMRRGGWAAKVTRNARTLLWSAVGAALLPFAGHLMSSFESIREPLENFFDQYASDLVQSAVSSVVQYVNVVWAQAGELLKTHAPLLALVSTVPLPNVKGVVEQTLLAYGAGLLAFFTFVLPSPETAQLYPVMLPLAIFGAIGVVNAFDLYLNNAVTAITNVWLRFFGTLTAVPMIGTAMTWFSSARLQAMQEEWGRGFDFPVSFQTGSITAVAVIGLIWQLAKKRGLRQPEVS